MSKYWKLIGVIALMISMLSSVTSHSFMKCEEYVSGIVICEFDAVSGYKYYKCEVSNPKYSSSSKMVGENSCAFLSSELKKASPNLCSDKDGKIKFTAVPCATKDGSCNTNYQSSSTFDLRANCPTFRHCQVSDVNCSWDNSTDWQCDITCEEGNESNYCYYVSINDNYYDFVKNKDHFHGTIEKLGCGKSEIAAFSADCATRTTNGSSNEKHDHLDRKCSSAPTCENPNCTQNGDKVSCTFACSDPDGDLESFYYGRTNPPTGQTVISQTNYYKVTTPEFSCSNIGYGSYTYYGYAKDSEGNKSNTVSGSFTCGNPCDTLSCIAYCTGNTAYTGGYCTPSLGTCGNYTSQDCGGNTYGDFVQYCSDSDLRKKRELTTRGCSAGACNQPSTSWVDDQLVQTCTYGCSNNTCKADPCQGKSCTSYCDGNTLQKSTGCSAGVCQYQSKSCSDGCDTNTNACRVCTPDHHKACSGNDLVIYDSCNNETDRENCPNGCQSNQSSRSASRVVNAAEEAMCIQQFAPACGLPSCSKQGAKLNCEVQCSDQDQGLKSVVFAVGDGTIANGLYSVNSNEIGGVTAKHSFLCSELPKGLLVVKMYANDVDGLKSNEVSTETMCELQPAPCDFSSQEDWGTLQCPGLFSYNYYLEDEQGNAEEDPFLEIKPVIEDNTGNIVYGAFVHSGAPTAEFMTLQSSNYLWAHTVSGNIDPTKSSYNTVANIVIRVPEELRQGSDKLSEFVLFRINFPHAYDGHNPYLHFHAKASVEGVTSPATIEKLSDVVGEKNVGNTFDYIRMKRGNENQGMMEEASRYVKIGNVAAENIQTYGGFTISTLINFLWIWKINSFSEDKLSSCEFLIRDDVVYADNVSKVALNNDISTIDECKNAKRIIVVLEMPEGYQYSERGESFCTTTKPQGKSRNCVLEWVNQDRTNILYTGLEGVGMYLSTQSSMFWSGAPYKNGATAWTVVPRFEGLEYQVNFPEFVGLQTPLPQRMVITDSSSDIVVIGRYTSSSDTRISQRLYWDINNNGTIDDDEATAAGGSIESNVQGSDLNGDGIVDGQDFLLMKAR